mmetsp:Transcript_23263/g.35895  ORF Transcript_23263/g.35895 Transcript_23263/m.35895 type:complete len:1396 (-) Transcript_23263:2625-6812(-)
MDNIGNVQSGSRDATVTSRGSLVEEQHIMEESYNLQNIHHIRSNVIKATKEVAFLIATEGVGEKEQAHGCLFIVGDADRLCATEQNFGEIGLPHFDLSENHKARKQYNVLECCPSNKKVGEEPSLSGLSRSISQRGIKSLCKEDGGIVIDGRSGEVWCGNFSVNDLSLGNSYGGTRGKAASSIAEQAGGCFVIKLSEEFCGSVDKPLPPNAEIEVYACSRNCIKERIPSFERATTSEELLVLKRTFDPVHSHSKFIVEKAIKSYVSGTREWTTKLFDDWLNLENKRSHKAMVLSAAAGAGKTTIAAKIVKERSDVVIAYHFCRHNDSRLDDPKKMLLSLAYQIAEKNHDFRGKLISFVTQHNITRERLYSQEYNLTSTFNTLLKEPLNYIEEPGKFVILVDALDECQHEGQNSILDCIQRNFLDLPSWLRIFVTTRPEIPVMHKLKRFKQELVKPEDSENDLRVFFQKVLAERQSGTSSDDSSSTSQDKRLDTTDAIGKLVKKCEGLKCEGLFIYAALLADTIRDADGKITQDMLDRLPDGIDEFYEEQFGRILNLGVDGKWYESIEWKLVELVVAAAEPLDVQLFQNFTGKPEIEIKKGIKKLSRFFPQDDDHKLYTNHKSLVDWLTRDNNGSDFYVDLKALDRFFANHCVTILNKCKIPGSTAASQIQLRNYEDAVIKYLLQHGVTHLFSAGMKAEARSLVLDIGWLITAAENLENHYNLLLYYERLSENDRVVKLIGRAIGLAMNAIRVDCRQLPGQLIGRLEGSILAQPEISDYVERLKKYSYGHTWWCPVGTCWGQADEPCTRVLESGIFGVLSIAWSPDGKQLASGSTRNFVKIWDLNTNNSPRVWVGRGKYCYLLTFSPDMQQLASSSSPFPNAIRICDISDYENSILMEGHSNCVRTILWSPDGGRLASGSEDKSVRIWNTTTGDCQRKFEGHSGSVTCVAWSADSQRLASRSDGGDIRLWDLSTGVCARVIQGFALELLCIAWSPNHEQLASGSVDGIIRIWDTKTGDGERIMEGHTGAVSSLEWSPSGNKLASGSHDNTVRIWDSDTGDCVTVMEGHTGSVTCVVWSMSNGQQLASGSKDGTIRIWDITNTTERYQTTTQDVTNTAKYVTYIAWSPDSQRLASGSDDGAVQIWDTNTGRCENTVHIHTGYASIIAWSPDGQKLVFGSSHGSIQIWNTHTGDCEKKLKGHSDHLSSIVWSPDGTRLASGSMIIRIWDSNTGVCKRTMEGHIDTVSCIAWSPNGERLASVSCDYSIRIWDADSGLCQILIREHTKARAPIAWSRNGQTIASGFDDKIIRIWEVSSGSCIQEYDTNSKLFSPDNFQSIPINWISDIVRDGSRFFGIECQKLSINSAKACAQINPSTISFFKLMGQRKRKRQGEKSGEV